VRVGILRNSGVVGVNVEEEKEEEEEFHNLRGS
jgi:hypothetical protein